MKYNRLFDVCKNPQVEIVYGKYNIAISNVKEHVIG